MSWYAWFGDVRRFLFSSRYSKERDPVLESIKREMAPRRGLESTKFTFVRRFISSEVDGGFTVDLALWFSEYKNILARSGRIILWLLYFAFHVREHHNHQSLASDAGNRTNVEAVGNCRTSAPWYGKSSAYGLTALGQTRGIDWRSRTRICDWWKILASCYRSCSCQVSP